MFSTLYFCKQKKFTKMNYISVESLVTVLLNSETQYGLGSSCCVAAKLLQGGYENDGVCAAAITRLWNRYSLRSFSSCLKA